MHINARKLIAVVFAVSMGVLTIASTRADARNYSLTLESNPEDVFAEGQKLSLKGDKLLNKGEKLMDEGQSLVDEGEKLIKDGNASLSNAQEDYRQHSTLRGSAANHKQVKKEAKRLKGISEDWANAMSDLQKGYKLVEKGEKKIVKARKQLREGHTLVDEGQFLIRNSELLRSGDLMLPQSG